MKARDPIAQRHFLGTILLAAGIAAWVAYFTLLAIGAEVAALPFLTWHLTGVLPGVFLRGSARRARRKEKA